MTLTFENDPPAGPMCAECGKQKQPRPAKAYATAEDFERDPFCSRICCEKFHGLKSRVPSKRGRKRIAA